MTKSLHLNYLKSNLNKVKGGQKIVSMMRTSRLKFGSIFINYGALDN
jgi:hypothetical protein